MPAVISPNGGPIGGNFYVATCNRDKDAAFIVRAVNSHDALVEAVKLLTAWDDLGATEREHALDLAHEALKVAAP